ncbi:hypothetical protein Y032_0241g3370 [Ancylostoma ceylanicum]|uniref:Uncharacterized protein n=1 Tax=Ancylostoma ceylanicum TaxID=53326 RepID=A0A016SER2_9BILA|nr:hypothetical protein Y032_0241g3370 [Ancylostoma ceylanicum]
MVYRVLSVLKTAGYWSPSETSARAPSTAENAEVRDHQWRRVVLSGSSVKNAKDMALPIQKGPSIVKNPRLWAQRRRKVSQRSALWEILG